MIHAFRIAIREAARAYLFGPRKPRRSKAEWKRLRDETTAKLKRERAAAKAEAVNAHLEAYRAVEKALLQ